MEPTVEARGPRVARQISENVAQKKSKKLEQLARAKTIGGFDKSRPQPHRTRKTMASVEDLLVCGICTKRMQKPKMLPCQHTFCSACLQKIMVGQEIKCPECAINVDLKDGLEALPSNLYLDSLLMALQKKDVDTPCNQCQTVTSLIPCRHCTQSLCPICWEHHVKEMQTLLLALGDQLQGAKERLNNRIKDFEEMCSTLLKQIDKAVELKIQALNEQRKLLKEEASQLHRNGGNSSKLLLQEIQRAEDRLGSGSVFDTFKDNDSKVSFFLELHGITSKLLGKVSHWGEGFPIMNNDTLKLISHDVVDHIHTQPDSASTEDSYSYEYRTRSFRTPRAQVGVVHPGGLAVRGNKLYVAGCDSRCVLVLDINKKLKLLQRLTCTSLIYPHSVAVNKSEIYVTDKWGHSIHVFSTLDGTYKRQLCRKGHGEGHLRSPEGIALGQGSDGQTDLLYVCDTGNDRVQVLRCEDGKVVRTLGVISPTPGSHLAHTELDQPTSVAVNHEKIVVMDFGNCRVKIYSLNGQKEAEFGSRGTFGSAECVALDKNGFILVGGSDLSRIFVFRPNGALVRTVTNSKFVSVSGLTVTSDMDIIIADNRTDSVLIY